jgi:hypothetical protein
MEGLETLTTSRNYITKIPRRLPTARWLAGSHGAI